MSEHIVRAYDKDLEALEHKISEMGGIAEKLMADVLEALTTFNLDLARSVVAGDTRLDALQRAVEEQAVLTIARRQPMAVDLRQTIAVIRIAGELERIGDLAKNISKRAIKIASEPRVQRPMIGLKHMGDLACTQLKDVLDAYAHRDADKAVNVWKRDTDIDALEDSVFRDLLTFMLEDARNISFCAHLLFCSKNIERAGDHSTNIAETVYYLVTGTNLPTERPKGPGHLVQV
jgi:phosphate transport system protein